jgi:hypothetical protein
VSEQCLTERQQTQNFFIMGTTEDRKLSAQSYWITHARSILKGGLNKVSSKNFLSLFMSEVISVQVGV